MFKIWIRKLWASVATNNYSCPTSNFIPKTCEEMLFLDLTETFLNRLLTGSLISTTGGEI